MLLITGQILFSLPCDHYGWFGQRRREVTIYRLCGVFIVLAGIACYAYSQAKKQEVILKNEEESEELRQEIFITITNDLESTMPTETPQNNLQHQSRGQEGDNEVND